MINYIHLHQIVYSLGRITPEGVHLLGTCFLINKPNTLVTASHVTGNDDKNLVVCFPKNSVDGYQDTSDLAVRSIPVKITQIDPIRDICILQGNLSGQVSNINIGSIDEVHPCDKLTLIGYPHCTLGRHVLTCQEATVGAKILIESSGIKSKHIVINIQARDGQSGSPVFRDSDSKLIGIVIGSYAPTGSGGISLGGIDPQTLHQTTHAISAEYINNMI